MIIVANGYEKPSYWYFKKSIFKIKKSHKIFSTFCKHNIFGVKIDNLKKIIFVTSLH